ncbi:NAD(P)-dependent oxidoreductase [Streptomyces sp. NPDC006879]|uniref:NAD(P)-dependent oxidoreductase n=1 Tax=Streptomyces sp. NPDC006879 TaxID=3364767 RepID=UPI003676150A
MRLSVCGATGGIGQELVRQALAAGHQVTAVVRDPARLTVSGPGLEVFRCDLRDPEALRKAVAGRDVVLSALGANRRSDAGIATVLTRSLLLAMEAEETRRLLVVSAAPLGAPPADEPWMDRLLAPVVKAAFAPMYEDLTDMEWELERSRSEWTSVRPPRLTHHCLTGTYRTVLGGNPRSARSIGRADVAHAMLSLMRAPATIRRAVGVAY